MIRRKKMAIPPPEYQPPPPEAPPEKHSVVVCPFLLGNGEVCGREFSNMKKLALHIRKSREGGEHGIRSPAHVLITTNCCPCCMTTFASRNVAWQHYLYAIVSGSCSADRAYFNYPLQEVEPPCCPHSFCPRHFEQFSDTLHLQWHVREHLRFPDNYYY